VINSNFGPISYRFRDTATYSLKHFIENCGRTAADGDTVILTAHRNLPAPYPIAPLPAPYDLPFSHNTERLAYHSALWLFKVIQSHRFSCHLKDNMRLPTGDQWQPRPHIASLSHSTSVIDRRRRQRRQTDRRQPYH